MWDDLSCAVTHSSCHSSQCGAEGLDSDSRAESFRERSKLNLYLGWFARNRTKITYRVLHPVQQFVRKKMLFTVWGVHTERKTKTQPSFFLVSCLSAFGPGSQTRCQFLVLISMFSAVLTDGETPGWLPSKGVINRTREAAASALTPCRGCLPGPRSRGQCLPFTPRYSCSLPWPFPAGKHAPHETASQSVPLFHPAPPFATRHSLFPLPK